MWLGKNGYSHIDQLSAVHLILNSVLFPCWTDFLLYLYSIIFTYSCNTGWYVQYIDRSPEALRREKDREKRQKDELDDEEVYNEAINAARERDIAVLGIYSTFRGIT